MRSRSPSSSTRRWGRTGEYYCEELERRARAEPARRFASSPFDYKERERSRGAALTINLHWCGGRPTMQSLFGVTEQEVEMAKAKHAIPEGYHTVTPQLTLENAAETIDWYKKAFGAEEKSRAVGPDGKV